MANTHGHLPKAERDHLPAELQQRLEVWANKAYADDNLFLTLAQSPGVLDMFLHWVTFVYTGAARIDPSTMELCRIRLAARNHCVHGSLARSASLMRKGLTEAQVEAALSELDTAALPAKTVAALRLVDLLTAPQPTVDEAAYQQLREHLDDREILELGAALSVGSGWQRFIEAFGIRPDAWTEATPLPWREHVSGAPGVRFDIVFPMRIFVLRRKKDLPISLHARARAKYRQVECLRAHSLWTRPHKEVTIGAENLFLRKQLAPYHERQVKSVISNTLMIKRGASCPV